MGFPSVDKTARGIIRRIVMTGWQILGLVILSPFVIAWLLVVVGCLVHSIREAWKEEREALYLCIALLVAVLLGIFLLSGGMSRLF